MFPKVCPTASSGGVFVKDAWDVAEAASDAAGHPYANRYGVNVNPMPPGKFESALRAYCRQYLRIAFPL